MVVIVENCQQDEACSTDDGEDDRQRDECLFPSGLVGDQPATVPKPSLRKKGHVKCDRGDGGHRDEKGLQLLSANIGDVGNVLSWPHGGIPPSIRAYDPMEQHCQKHGEPN